MGASAAGCGYGGALRACTGSEWSRGSMRMPATGRQRSGASWFAELETVPSEPSGGRVGGRVVQAPYGHDVATARLVLASRAAGLRPRTARAVAERGRR